MFRAEEIGVSLGTGLDRVRHRIEGYTDIKSRPSEEMADWLISSNWAPPESDDDNDDDNDEDEEVYIPDDNKNDDENNNNDDHNNGSSTAAITASA